MTDELIRAGVNAHSKSVSSRANGEDELYALGGALVDEGIRVFAEVMGRHELADMLREIANDLSSSNDNGAAVVAIPHMGCVS